MTNAPNPGKKPEPTPGNQPKGNQPKQSSTKGLWQRQRRRLGIGLGIVVLAGIGGGGTWGWFFIHRQLAPMVETSIARLLNRPVNMGKVEGFSLNGLQFGATAVPVTPTDSDRVSIEKVEVAFNPVQLLLTRTLEMQVTLVNPNIYIEQDKEGRWISTEIQTLEKGAIDVKLQELRVRNGKVVLAPRGAEGNPKTPVAIALPSGNSRFLNDNTLIQFGLQGSLLTGGNFTIQGESRPKTGDTKLVVSGSDVGAPEVGRLIQLPLLLQAGRLDGNLEIQMPDNQPLKFLGTATLENVTARLPQLPTPFSKTNGQLRFRGTKVGLEQVTGLFGQVPAQVNGVLDTQADINLSAQTQPVEVKKVLQAFDFKQLPVVVSGEVQSTLQVTGRLSEPIVSGQVVTTKLARIDKVNFRTISSGFRLAGSKLTVTNLRATPTIGGLVTGNGVVTLGEKGSAVFDVQATNVPGEAIAKNYEVDLSVPVGLVSGRTQIFTSLANPQNFRASGTANLKVAGGSVTARNVQVTGKRFTAQVRASDVQVERLAEVPPQFRGLISGNFNLSGPLENLSASTIRGSGSGSLNVAGGTVTARNAQLNNGRFSAQVQASGVQVERLAEVPPQLRGPLSGNFNVSGSVADASSSTISGSGSGSLNVAGGTVTARNVQLNNGRFSAQVQASGVQVERLAEVPPAFKGPLSGNFNLSGSLENLSASTISGNGSGSLNVAGGTVTARNLQLANGRFTTQVQASGVQVERLASVPPQFKGPLSGNFNLSGSLENFSASTISGSGSGSLNVAGGTISATNVKLENGGFSAQVQASRVQVERLATVPPELRGPLSGNFNLSGSLENLSPSTISASGLGSLNVAGGTIAANNVQVNQGRFSAQVQASSVQVERLASVPPEYRGPFSGNFNLSGSLDNLSPSTISGNGSGSLTVAGGTVTASNVQLNEGRFSAQVQASSVQVERLASVPPQFRGPLSGNFNLSGSLANLSPSTISASGSGSLTVAGGTVTASNVQLANGRFQAVVEPTGVQLADFSEDLRGRLAGKVNVSGSLTATNPSAIQASGRLNFSEGIALVDGPLTADIVWNGEQLEIQQAIAPRFNASGVVNVNPANQGLQAIRSFNLNVRAEDLNLQQLPATLPNNVTVAGRADFNGRLVGTVSSPNVNGTIALRDFAVDGLTFESPLEGSVSTVAGQGLNLNLAGNNDQIQLALTPNYEPVSFLIKRGEAIAQGDRQGDVLRVSTQSFPISLIRQLAPAETAIASQPLSGEISGSVDVNLKTFDIALNNVAITGPIFVPARGDQSPPGDNRYLLSGKISRTATGPQFQNLQLRIDQGELQVVLAALQAFDLAKVNRSFNASGGTLVAPVSLQDASLQTQLRRLSEIKALEQQNEEREAASTLPDFTQARGRFTGAITVDGSLASGINTTIDIQGQNWVLDSYKADQVSIIGEGSLQNGVLTLLPLRIQSGDSLISYAGTIGGEAQSGQLQLRNIPIDQLEAVLQKVPNLPQTVTGLTGYLNATATVSGSINNPQARGELSLVDAAINQTEVQTAQSSFSYANARLNFGSTVLLAGSADPLNINGSIPYKLPMASVEPTDNQLNLNIDVQNEGIGLLNLFTDGQVSWVNGTGDVRLQVNGTYDQNASRLSQLVAQGVASVENATIQARSLPEPLTNVTGRVLFNLDNIQVESVQGQFSGGIITAAGTIPISRFVPQENPLAINIGELALNLKGLYSGRVQGGVVIAGTALAPSISGEVNLFDGQVKLAQTGAESAGGGGGGTADQSAANNSVEFNGLKLTLGKGIQITQNPILGFLANGTLTLNGPLDNLRPEGTIELQRGEVNLFTTQFRLARSYENTAKFLPNRGLDPILDVRLQASVAETTQGRLPTDPLSAEISDVLVTNFGTLQSVRIQARVEGPASQIADNLELTSTPSRSEAEIVALLGGRFVDTLGRGDSTLGLVNLAGSALLSNVQNVIGDALGLSEFRLFPTIIRNDEKRTSSLGLAAEAGIDITRNISVSVSKELTTDQPFQYSLRYRLNENLRVRGLTDLSGESGAIVEYERRF